jgi:hypothetical protein
LATFAEQPSLTALTEVVEDLDERIDASMSSVINKAESFETAAVAAARE